MRSARRAAVAAAAALAIAGVLAAGCAAKPHAGSPVAPAAPGATTSSLVIGGWGPLTGNADPGAAGFAAGMDAYFAWVNARGGVYGRAVVYRYLDDGGNVAFVLSLAHRLVQQDAVFAVVGADGTAADLTAVPFLASSGVPDLLPGSGCSCLPAGTAGYEPGGIREAKILGAWIARAFPAARIGVVYQDDPDGRDGLAGLAVEIPARQVVTRQPCPPAARDLAAQVTALKAARVQVVIALTTPAVTAALVPAMAAAGYHPQVAAPSTAEPATSGIITDSYLPGPAAPRAKAAGTWTTLFTAIWHRRHPGMSLTSPVITGMATAYAFTQALTLAGPVPTRQAVTTALARLPQGPAAAPYDPASGGITGAWIARTGPDGTLTLLTGTWTTGTTPDSPVTPDTTAQPPAPPSGLPPR